MADIIDAGQERRVKVRLEMGIEQGLSVHVQLILIGIQHIAGGIGPDLSGASVERILGQCIVMVCQDEIVAFRHLHGRIGVPGEPPVLAQDHIAETGVCPGILLEHLLHALPCRAPVCDTGLPVPIGLAADGVQKLP